jgi:hypothetical protein
VAMRIKSDQQMVHKPLSAGLIEPSVPDELQRIEARNAELRRSGRRRTALGNLSMTTVPLCREYRPS